MLFEVIMNKPNKTSNNVIFVQFSSKQKNVLSKTSHDTETLAEMFKRHKILIPCQLLFND